MKVYSWQTVNLGNLAEQVCRPTDYFDLCVEVEVVPQESREMPEDSPIVFGGSGLLYPEISPVLETSALHNKFPLVAWGIGHNTHGGDRIDYPDWLKKFALVGLRDWGAPFDWVPCPSCMHPAFSQSYPAPSHPVVVYDQIDYPVAMDVDAPRQNNCQPREKMNEIVEFLASGETILTSSYHGAYWGMLLNRRVLVWKPWSTKFRTLPPTVEFVDESDWRAKSTLTQVHLGFLAECRRANVKFFERVRALFNRHL